MEIRVEPTSIERLVDTVANTINESFKNVTIDDANMYKLGYNKALDDLMAKLDCDKYLLNDWQRDAIRDKVKEIKEESN
jgi:hypothetical protein|nr:MAG TPA: hypothetical protein [Caudoviricetes sp.]